MANPPPQSSVLTNPNLRIIFLVTLMAVLGVSSITPAFPQIARALQVAKPSVGLLIMVFTLPGIFLTPVLGVLADRHGRKKVLVPALFLFAAAGSACFFADTFHLLLILRFLQGCGAASLSALNVTMIGDLFSGRQRAAAMGYNASVLSVATASYPFIGGLLTGLGWRYVFLLPLLAVPIGLLVLFRLHSPEPQQRQNMRLYLRNVTISLRHRLALLYFGAGLVFFIMLYGPYLTYLPLFLAEKFQAQPLQIGLTFSAMSVVTAVTSSQAGRLARRFGERFLLKLSFILYGCAFCLLPFLPTIGMVALPISLYGLGQGVNMPSLQTLLAGLAPLEYRAAFMAMNGMVLRLGQTLGPLIAGAFYMLGGTAAAFFSGAAFALLMFLLLVVWAKESTASPIR